MRTVRNENGPSTWDAVYADCTETSAPRALLNVFAIICASDFFFTECKVGVLSGKVLLGVAVH